MKQQHRNRHHDSPTSNAPVPAAKTAIEIVLATVTKRLTVATVLTAAAAARGIHAICCHYNNSNIGSNPASTCHRGRVRVSRLCCSDMHVWLGACLTVLQSFTPTCIHAYKLNYVRTNMYACVDTDVQEWIHLSKLLPVHLESKIPPTHISGCGYMHSFHGHAEE